MARQVKLRLTSDGANLNSVGDIYRAPVMPGMHPVVTDVFARNTRASLFQINPGDYEYRYYVQDGTGSYTISVCYDNETTPFQSSTFDATYTRGNIFAFSVTADGGGT